MCQEYHDDDRYIFFNNLNIHPGSILSVESNQNVEFKTKNVESKIEKYGVQNSTWPVDSQENH